MKEQDPLPTSARGVDRLPCHVEEGGSGDAICIFLHGFGDGGYVWYDFAPRLPKNYRTLIIDFRGHGNSADDPAANYGVAPYCTDVLNIIHKYQLKNISLVGHSLGASVALRIAAAVPHLVSDLILVDFSLSTEQTVFDNILSQFDEQCMGYASRAEYAAWISTKRPLTHPRMLDYIVDNALRETADGRFVLKVDPRIQQIIKTGSSRTDDVRPILSRVLCRTLLIRGRGSAVLSKKAALDIVRLLNDAQLCEISHSGHAVMVENPDGFAEAVYKFLLGARTRSGGV